MEDQPRTYKPIAHWEIASNLTLGAIFLWFAYRYYLHFQTTGNVSSLLLLISVSIFVVFFLIREYPKRTSFSPICWILAIGGTFVVLLLEPIDSPNLLIGTLIQSVGVVTQTIATLSLNRSFGIVPSNRGIKTNGMYKLVRHPLYSSYFITYTGYIINSFSWYNFSIVFLDMALQVARIRREELLLMEDEDYQSYAARTPWRILPYVY